MNIYTDIPDCGAFANPVLTIGSFDGVHLGHHRILSVLLNTARERSGDAVVLTFRDHPRAVLTPHTPPKILTTADEKIEAIGEHGVSHIIMLPFTRAMAEMSAEEFLGEMVLKKLGVTGLVVGYDHAFGKNRAGTFDFLRSVSHERGFGVVRVEPRNFYSRPVSSTWIRTELEDGNVALAAMLLGRRYRFGGTVVRGAGRGRTIGFPTANVRPDDPAKVIPRDGVYAVTVSLPGGLRRQGMLNIGTNPTFAETERTIEVNIFDFEADIYGAPIGVFFHERIRDEVRFADARELAAQIERDRRAALELLNE
ncbi:MAG TPA: bifunctional riboflavin kinase/FAD synthetase [Spirochaetota bacterium]|nr:bifunctional riboflavin kinase/FAD synthetase [Spirochaetota bacterium]HOS38858.1 bifunctional riboflavin kinase/FAD synthetase [Spirochaetota bacterium]HPI21768.1 bifunctional riboflavin kinase/FAD synthetase [Spirochaetota bacterium]HPU88128.1 bifunctional riboflavin kinase/FAD synthetase [Spirochaetota bacterium]